MRDIVDVIEQDIVEKIDLRVKVKTVIEINETFIRFTSCNYKWPRLL